MTCPRHFHDTSHRVHVDISGECGWSPAALARIRIIRDSLTSRLATGVAMKRFRKTPTVIFIMMAMLVMAAGVLAQQKEGGKDGDTGVSADTLRRHFTENADRYYIPAYPQFWFGVGVWFAKPDLGDMDAGFVPGDRPSKSKLSPAFFFAARIQITRHFSSTVSMTGIEHGKGGYSRSAVSLCAHLPFSKYTASDLFAGIGAARVRYRHDGATAGSERISINASRNALHFIAGLNLIIPNGPGVTLVAGFESMSEENGFDLSTPFAQISIMF